MPDLDRLRQVRGFVLDMDGTLVLGDKNNQGLNPLPGALDFVRTLADLDLPFCILTNGTTRTPDQYADSLRQVGFPMTADRMLTPTSAAVELFLQRGYRRVMVLGGKGITEPLEAVGIEAVPPLRGTAVDAVMAGWFRQELSFETLEAAVFAVFDGADFYSASQSLFFATAEGNSLGTSRAISAVVTDITGCEVTVVGDDPELEVPMAHRGGSFAIAVHTGIGHAESFADLSEDVSPHLDLPDVGALAELLRR